VSQAWAYGQAETDTYIAVRRKRTNQLEYYHVVGDENIPISASEYDKAVQQ
jgi:hypothetical protein